MAEVMIINNEYFGKGNDELGKKLMGAFLKKLWVQEKKPDFIILYNSGVKLIAEGSDCIDAFYGLEESGIEVLACGTCVEFYQLENKVRVGRISNMEEICGLMMKAEKVITI